MKKILLLALLLAQEFCLFSQIKTEIKYCNTIEASLEEKYSFMSNATNLFVLERLMYPGIWISLQKTSTFNIAHEFKNLPEGVYKIKLVVSPELTSGRIDSKHMVLSSTPIEINSCLNTNNKPPDIFIVPNPASEFITLSLSQSDSQEVYFYSLYDIFGRRLQRIQVEKTPQKVSISTLKPGFYTIALESEYESIIRKKLVVK
jgi:hypothetical protein